MEKGLTVLVVDDDPAIRKSVGLTLKGLGWAALEAADGQEGMSILRDQAVDVVISDVWMPHMDGIGFVKDACELRPGLKILAISGGGSAPAALSLKMLQMRGAQDFLYKPFTDEELRDKLQALVDSESRADATG